MPVSIGLLGAYEQWGYCNNSSQISFPMAYKTKCYAITFGVHYNGSQYGYNQVVSYNTLGFTMYQTVGTNGLAIMWIALGVQQWGTFEKCSVYVVYPIPFSAFASVVAAIDSTDNEACQCRDVQLTKFLPWQKYSNYQGKWMAVGR